MNKIKDESETVVQNIQDIDSRSVAHHALIETRLLPGGFYVMGIFVINPKNVFEDPNLLLTVKTMLIGIQKTFESDVPLHGNCDELDGGEKLVFFYSSSSNFYCCKSVALKSPNLSVKPCDWKFQDRATSWQVMNTFFETDETFALRKKKDDQYDTESNLTACVEVLQHQLDKSVVFFDGGPKDGKLLLESALQDKKEEPFLVHVYTPLVSCNQLFLDPSPHLFVISCRVEFCHFVRNAALLMCTLQYISSAIISKISPSVPAIKQRHFHT